MTTLHLTNRQSPTLTTDWNVIYRIVPRLYLCNESFVPLYGKSTERLGTDGPLSLGKKAIETFSD